MVGKGGWVGKGKKREKMKKCLLVGTVSCFIGVLSNVASGFDFAP